MKNMITRTQNPHPTSSKHLKLKPEILTKCNKLKYASHKLNYSQINLKTSCYLYI